MTRLHDTPNPGQGKKEGKNIIGECSDKNNRKQILCSFITKYSATINIAFLSPFQLYLRMFTLSGFLPLINTSKYEV